MDGKRLFKEIRTNLSLVIKQDTPYGLSLWRALIAQHPADIITFLQSLDDRDIASLFEGFPKQLRLDIFELAPEPLKVHFLGSMNDDETVDAFHTLSVDELTDLFDYFSDEELKKYLNLLHQRIREKVLSMLKFNPDSAGGIMTVDVLSLVEDYTVEKAIKLLQRLRPSKEIHQHIFVTNRAHHLVGYINLEDLVLHKPDERVMEFMQKNPLVVHADLDKERVAKKMIHYDLTIVPVVDHDNHFLGIIPSETLVDVIVEESAEDVSKMAALTPLKYPYFQTSIARLFYERGHILAVLLIVESFSGTILKVYESSLSVLLYSFIPMLISVGGNTSSQTSAMVIQGMASGEITFANMYRFLRKESLVAGMLALGLGIISFARVYWTSGALLESVTVSIALASIVLLSALLGSCIPLIFKRLNLDPAFSAGPFLATAMDIIGILIFCYLSKLILF